MEWGGLICSGLKEKLNGR